MERERTVLEDGKSEKDDQKTRHRVPRSRDSKKRIVEYPKSRAKSKCISKRAKLKYERRIGTRARASKRRNKVDRDYNRKENYTFAWADQSESCDPGRETTDAGVWLGALARAAKSSTLHGRSRKRGSGGRGGACIIRYQRPVGNWRGRCRCRGRRGGGRQSLVHVWYCPCCGYILLLVAIRRIWVGMNG
jgi:hypothetical protein